MAEPLRIGVEINVADMLKLSGASKDVASAVDSLTEQFNKSEISSKEFQSGIQSAADAFFTANPKIAEFYTRINELSGAQKKFASEAKELTAGLYVQGQLIGGTADYMARLEAAELQAGRSSAQLTATKKELNVELAKLASASAEAGAATKQDTTDAVQNAEAQAAQSVELRALTGAMSETVAQATAMGRAITASSAEAQAAGERYERLSGALAYVREQLALVSEETAKVGLSQEQQAAAQAKKLELTVTENLLDAQAKEAKRDLAAEIDHATNAYLRNNVEAEKAAAQSGVSATALTGEAAQAQNAAAAFDRVSAARTAQAEAEIRYRTAIATRAAVAGTTPEEEAAADREVDEAAKHLELTETELAAAKQADATAGQEQVVSSQQVKEAVIEEAAAVSGTTTSLAAMKAEILAGLGPAAQIAANLLLDGESAANAASALQNYEYTVSESSAAVAAAQANIDTYTEKQNIAAQATQNLGQQIAATTAQFRPSAVLLNQNAAATAQLGVSAAGAASPFLTLGITGANAYGKIQIAAAGATPPVAGVGNAAAKAGAQAGAATPPIQGAANAIAATGNQAALATPKVDTWTRAVASSGVRIGATELGVGQLGYALARIGSISTTLAPIMAAAFPVFAAFAFFQIMEMLGKKMEEWADIEEKSAEENAKWERAILKTADAVDKMNEKLAGMFSPLADISERMANLGKKTVDLTADMKMMYERLDDGPSAWKTFKEDVGGAAVEAYHAFESASSAAGREFEKNNKKIIDGIKTQADIAPAIERMRGQIAQMEAARRSVNLAAFSEADDADFKRRIAIANEGLTILMNAERAYELEKLELQESMNEKLFAEEERSVNARISLHEEEIKALEKFHAITPEDALTATLTQIDDKYKAKKDKLEHDLEGLIALQKAAGAPVPSPTATLSPVAAPLPVLPPGPTVEAPAETVPAAAAAPAAAAGGITVDQIAHAIADAEGYGKAGAIPTVNFNPGDIKDIATGTIKKFDTVADGWAALEKQVQSMTSGASKTYPAGMTLEEGGIKYSGHTPGPGGSEDWVKNVSAALGVPPSTPLTSLVGAVPGPAPAPGAPEFAAPTAAAAPAAPTVPGAVDQTAAIAAKRKEIADVEVDEQKAALAAISDFHKKELSDSLAATLAEVNGAKEVTAALDKQSLALAKIQFQHADTPELVTAATKVQIDLETTAYNHEAEAAKKAADAKLDNFNAGLKLAGTKPIEKPTAEFGTEEYAKQLDGVKALDASLYNELVSMNAREMAARVTQATKIAGLENDKANKIRTIRAEELTNEIKELNDGLINEREKYQQGSFAIKASLDERKLKWSDYYGAVETLAEKNYREQLNLYGQESDAVRKGVADHVLTEQQGNTKLLEIWRKEELAFKQMKQREAQAAEEAIRKEQHDIKAAADKIGQEFAKMAHTILTSHKSIGQTAAELSKELILFIVEKGIKTVVAHYAAGLVQMLAEHSRFLADLLGIKVAGKAAEAAVDKAKAASEIATSAGEAGAAGFASVMMAVPFPENVAMAPGVAAASSAGATTAGAAALFERGGIVTANLHEGEMVLPKHISTFVQTAAASAGGRAGGVGASGNTYRTNKMHLEYHSHGGPGIQKEELGKLIGKLMRRGEIPHV